MAYRAELMCDEGQDAVLRAARIGIKKLILQALRKEADLSRGTRKAICDHVFDNSEEIEEKLVAIIDEQMLEMRDEAVNDVEQDFAENFVSVETYSDLCREKEDLEEQIEELEDAMEAKKDTIIIDGIEHKWDDMQKVFTSQTGRTFSVQETDDCLRNCSW